MKLSEIQRRLESDVVVGWTDDVEVPTACGSDLISDILRFTEAGSALLTGLTSLQMIRTADLLDISVIVFVRGKIPNQHILHHAAEMQIPILCTPFTLYEACGMLFEGGLKACQRTVSLKEHNA